MLSLRWREQVKREVKTPEHEGFGSRLITMNVTREIGGSVQRDYTRHGFVAELRLPWDPSTCEIVLRLDHSASRPPVAAEQA